MHQPRNGRPAGRLGRTRRTRVRGRRALARTATGCRAGTPGEIGVRGDGLFSAYYAPWVLREDIARDGWFLTGDIGSSRRRRRADLHGRKKAVIFVAGLKFFPEEVEACINAFPGSGSRAYSGRRTLTSVRCLGPRWSSTPRAPRWTRSRALRARAVAVQGSGGVHDRRSDREDAGRQDPPAHRGDGGRRGTLVMRVAILGAGPAGSALAIFLTRGGRGDPVRRRPPAGAAGRGVARAGRRSHSSASRPRGGDGRVWPREARCFIHLAGDDALQLHLRSLRAFRVPVRLQHRAPAVRRRHRRQGHRGGRSSGASRERASRPVHPTGRERSWSSPETLNAAPSLAGRQPDLIVDATGRARHAARVLGIGAHLGPRKDVAHFAHFENFQWDDAPGQVLIARGEAGWSWCIPLRIACRWASCWDRRTPPASGARRTSGCRRPSRATPGSRASWETASA